MNNVRAELTDESNASHVPQRKERARPDDPIRDFFRRGDHGQYEGGPADRIDSLPALDLPEKPQVVVRTPQQQARRRALIRLEVALLSGCLALLVMAARARSIDAANPVHTTSTQLQAPPVTPTDVRAQSVVPPAAVREASLPTKPVEAAPPKTNASASVVTPASVPVAPGPNEAAQSAQAKANSVPVSPASNEKPALASEKKQASKVQQARAAAESAPRVAAARKATAAIPPAAPPVAATAPKRAVAAFPDD